MKKQEIIHSQPLQHQEGPLPMKKELSASQQNTALNHSAYFNNLNLSTMIDAPRSETVYVKRNFRFGMSSQKYGTNSRKEQRGEEAKQRVKNKRHRSLEAQHKKMISSANVNSKNSMKTKIHNFKFMKQNTIVETESDNAGILLDENYNLRKEVERLQCQLERGNDLFKASQQELYSLEIELDEEKKQSNELRKQVQYLQTRAFDNNDRSFSPQTLENYLPAQSPPQRRSSVPNRIKIAQNFCQESKNELQEMNQKIDEVLREKKRVEEFYQIYSINERLTERVNAMEEINSTLKQALISKDTIIAKVRSILQQGETQFKELKQQQSVLQKENETVRTQYIQSRAIIDQIITAVSLFDKGTINSSKLSKMLHRSLNLSAKGLSTPASEIDHKIPADLESHYSKASRMPTLVAPSLVGDHASYTSSESGHDVSRIEEQEQETARSVSPHLLSNYNSQQDRKPRFIGQASLYSNYESDEDDIKRSSHFISLEKQLKDKIHFFPRTPLSQRTPLVCKSPCSQFLINSRYGDTEVERTSELLSRNNIDASNFMSFGRLKKDKIEEEEKHNTSEDEAGGVEMTPEMGKFRMQGPNQKLPASHFDSEMMQLALKELAAQQRIDSRDIQEIRNNFRDFKFDQKLKDSKIYILMTLLYKKIETLSKKHNQIVPPISETPDQMIQTVYTKTSENSSVPLISGLKNLETNAYRSTYQDSQKRLGASIMASLFTPRIVAKGRALLAPQSIVAKIVQTTKESIDQEREMAKTVH